MNQVLQNRNVNTISNFMPLDLKTELFRKIMGDRHRLDWRTALRRLEERAKRLAKRLRK